MCCRSGRAADWRAVFIRILHLSEACHLGLTSNCKPYARYDRLPAACCLLVSVTRPPPQKRIIPGSDSPPFVVAEGLTMRIVDDSVHQHNSSSLSGTGERASIPRSEDGNRQYVNHVVEKEGQTIDRLALGRQPSDLTTAPPAPQRESFKSVH